MRNSNFFSMQTTIHLETETTMCVLFLSPTFITCLTDLVLLITAHLLSVTASVYIYLTRGQYSHTIMTQSSRLITVQSIIALQLYDCVLNLAACPLYISMLPKNQSLTSIRSRNILDM